MTRPVSMDRFVWKPGDVQWVDAPPARTSAQKIAASIPKRPRTKGGEGGTGRGGQRPAGS